VLLPGAPLTLRPRPPASHPLPTPQAAQTGGQVFGCQKSRFVGSRIEEFNGKQARRQKHIASAWGPCAVWAPADAA
jgi:hypothetical protein